MSEDSQAASAGSGADEIDPSDLGHPRGTLAIVILYGLVFALVWMGIYVWGFMERGALTH